MSIYILSLILIIFHLLGKLIVTNNNRKEKNFINNFKTCSLSVDKNIINRINLEDYDNINKFSDYTIGDNINLYTNISKFLYIISYIKLNSFI